MQTTITATLVKNQSNIEQIKTQLDNVVVLHSLVQRKLYKDIISYKLKHNVDSLPNLKINELKSSYQLKYNINARQYSSIYMDLMGKISSVLELNKSYIEDTKDKILKLDKAVKSKQKSLDLLSNKMINKDYISSKVDESNLSNIKTKLYHLNNKLNKANNKLKRLNSIKEKGNPKLCFGSNKLFRQQFEINKPNNLTEFKTHKDWYKSFVESRNKSFVSIGSSDENYGNSNCQITKVKNNVLNNNNIYELKLNINPKEIKLKDRYIKVLIEVHNDKSNLIANVLDNTNLKQAITYRFYKDNKRNTYTVLISLDKSKQQPNLISSKLLGTVGIDINADHLSVSEVDRFGNLIKAFDIQLDLKGKTTEQARNNIALAVKEITNYAVRVSKPIVIEKLDFTNKKKELKSTI